MRQLKIIFMVLICAKAAFAQDPHYSQYFSSPLTLNPANTGNFIGQNRFGFNFRNQWSGIGDPYITGTGSYETKIFKNLAGRGNEFAFGISGLYDRTSGGLLTSNFFSTSLGYHISLDAEGTNKLSIGFQSTFSTKKLDYANISFANQITSSGFNLNMPSNQSFQSGIISYWDWNTGLSYRKEKENYSYYTGISSYHLTRPNESFLGNQKNRIPFRTTIHAGGNMNIGETDVLIGSGLINSQGKSIEAMVGFAYGTMLNTSANDIILMAGTWYRLNDAIIPYVGYIFNNFQLGISYDIKIMGKGNGYNKSFEISLAHHLYDNSEFNRLIQTCKF